MIKNKNVLKDNHHLHADSDSRQTLKLIKKKPKRQTIIKNLKAHI